VRPAGELIALYGGFAASIALAVSGLALWALSEVAGMPASASAIRVLHLLSFAAGGPGTVVPLGLLVAGVSVPSGLTRKLPLWLVWFGLVVALLAELSTLVLVVPGAAVLLPIGRFGAFAWLLGTAIAMPSTRSRAARTS
ncbi:MAG: hypothetical protein JWN44_5555, partial [Myxococcales bacterium]|nr:hypothetical protein [Myxococcales bacterium]